MKIDMMNAVVGVSAGAVDGLLEWQDEEGGRTEPFKTWTDWGRVVLCSLGYLGQAFNFFPKIAAPLAQSEITLVTKSVGKVIRTRAGTESMVSRPRTRLAQTPGPGFEKLPSMY